jgi:FkbM family methyltransferase
MLRSVQLLASAASSAIGRNTRVIEHLRPAYESILELLSGGRGVPWEINGATFRIDPRYRSHFGHDYDAPVAQFLSQRIRPGAICFDVGANVGVYALQFAQWAGPTGKVIAFEPNPAAVKVLSKHLRLNGLENVVAVKDVAIGSAPGTATLYRSGIDGMSRCGEPNKLLVSTEPIAVPMMTIDDFTAHSGLLPDWILMDIEGFEFAALSGAVRTLERSRGKLGLVVEIHPDAWSSAGTTQAIAAQFLSDMGLRAVPLTGQRDSLAEYGLVHLSWHECVLGSKPKVCDVV